MKFTRTSSKLTAIALGVVALFSAAAIAGVSRGKEMQSSGVVTIEQTAPAARADTPPAAPWNVPRDSSRNGHYR